MRWKAGERVPVGATEVIEGFLFWPRRLYTDRRWKEREWRWLERARIEQIREPWGWREMMWLPPEEER